MDFLRFAPEERLRIYEYAFGDTTIGYTRPVTGYRARCYNTARQNLGLLTASKAIYLEAWPLYLSLIRLVLTGTSIDEIPAYLQATVLPKIRSIELIWVRSYQFDPTKLPALRTLKLTQLGYGMPILPMGMGGGTNEDYIDGLRDREVVQGVQQQLETPNPSVRWLHDVYKQEREFKILLLVEKQFQRIPRVNLALLIDVDASTVLERTFSDHEKRVIKIWKNGKIRTHTLHKSGKEGKLLQTEDWL